MANITRLVLFIFLISTSFKLSAQKTVLDILVDVPETTASVKSHLAILESKTDASFTYSTGFLNTDKIVSISYKRQSVRQHLQDILKGQNVKFTLSSTNRILLSKAKKKYQLVGVIYDDFLKEGLMGVSVRNVSDGRYVHSDEDGYFTVACNDSIVTMEFSYLGFDDLKTQVKLDGKVKSFYLTSGTVFPAVLITEKNLSNTISGNPEKDIIKPINIGSFSNFLGDNSVSDEIKALPFVQSGNEAESGYHVRGGGIDQNLILFEGTPMYESNHTAGLSSIFIADAIKDIAIYAESFPARYGGRLSSVMDVRLKSGKSDSIVGSSAIGLTGLNFYSSGPLTSNKKLLFNVSGRLSLIHLYVSPFLRSAFGYDNSDFRYYDANAKLTYQFDPSHSLSVFSYSGKDQVELNRTTINTRGENDEITFENNERNEVGWGNNVLGLNYSNLLSDKLVLKSHFSTLNYNYSSRGSYRFIRSENDSIVNDNEIDIVSFSSIRDFNSFLDLSYYHSDNIFYKVGVGRQIHIYNPTIRQSTTIVEQNTDQFADGDSSILVKDQFIYAEANITPFHNLNINTGVRLSSYNVRDKDYSYTEPRFEIAYRPYEGHRVSASYAQMVQYVHLLVSPSTGLPSDLWVPSTENIAPEFGQQYSFSYSFYKKDNFKIRLGFYYKEMENLLEYDNPSDLFYGFISEGDFVPIFITSNEWERRVTSGVGLSRGVEINFEKAFANGKFNFTYSYGKATRSFANINNGEEFPYKYDRTHDINTSILFNLGKNWDFAAKWIYGTGNTFTLATEQFLTPEGVIVIRPTGRNNFRHLPFHHLDANVNYIFTYRRLACRLSVGVYNAYNRLNPFYIYIDRDPVQSSIVRARQVSLFPVIPHIGLKVSW